jgi:hypothetical protein
VGSDLRVALAGIYISGVSLLVVYHMFALQGWIQRCEVVLAEGRVIHEGTTTDDLGRLRARSNCHAVQRSYPWVQLSAVTAALGYVTYLTIRVSRGVAHLDPADLAGPIIVFDALILLTTAGVTWRYLGALRRMKGLLSSPEPRSVTR